MDPYNKNTGRALEPVSSGRDFQTRNSEVQLLRPTTDKWELIKPELLYSKGCYHLSDKT